MVPTYPLYLLCEPDMLVLSSPDAVGRHIEESDAKDNIYTAFDAEGYELAIKLDRGAVTPKKTHYRTPKKLHDAVERCLLAHGIPVTESDDVLAIARERFPKN